MFRQRYIVVLGSGQKGGRAGVGSGGGRGSRVVVVVVVVVMMVRGCFDGPY